MTTGDEPQAENRNEPAVDPAIDPGIDGVGPKSASGTHQGGETPPIAELTEPAERIETDDVGEHDDPATDDLVGGLFREVDDRFNRLEAQYQLARQDLTAPETGAPGPGLDPIAASAARYELYSEVATLRADVERQNIELDERDRMLAELSNRIVGFEERLKAAGEAGRTAERLRQELHEERRELSRVQALLEARAAEREELAQAAQRLKNEKDHLDTLLATAMQRFEEAESVRADLVENLARIEAVQANEAAEHGHRHQDLIDSRAEGRRLTELVDELTTARNEASRRADKAESKIERRGNEVNYLNRRIESLSERAKESDRLDGELRSVSETNALLIRQISDVQRELESQVAKASAAAAAVEAIADRSAQHDDLVARIAELEEEAAARRENESSRPTRQTGELQDLAGRARELGGRRTSGAYVPLPSIEATGSAASLRSEGSGASVSSPGIGSVDADPGHDAPGHDAPGDDTPAHADPEVENISWADQAVASQSAVPDPRPPPPPAPATAQPQPPPEPPPTSAAPEPPVNPMSPAAPPVAVAPQFEMFVPAVTPPVPASAPLPLPVDPAPAFSIDSGSMHGIAGRARLVLPPEMAPDTPAAVAYLLAQPGVTAIVDARSFCGRTGVRPSELFERMVALRDRFDLPVEVVVTPVSTPVGGAPNLAAIGVHHITGADTVADRIRALCIGFPPDQPLVVVAGDDHVRRAAIGEEANVVDPAVLLDIT